MDEPWIGSVSGLKGRKRILGEIWFGGERPLLHHVSSHLQNVKSTPSENWGGVWATHRQRRKISRFIFIILFCQTKQSP
jgi:hypothetical protein